jgi:hypothetical protein
MATEWYPAEGAALASVSPRAVPKFESSESARFAVEHVAVHEHAPVVRERELTLKLHDLLASPLGEPVARILDETHRLLPHARVASAYE